MEPFHQFFLPRIMDEGGDVELVEDDLVELVDRALLAEWDRGTDKTQLIRGTDEISSHFFVVDSTNSHPSRSGSCCSRRFHGGQFFFTYNRNPLERVLTV
ncbi:hypothetical protein PGT21_024264 [Puccinia graminis f. sp. tritici]|uniref:Uncharacterized protein n=1 Tax=Puccinia graminis f. sp. tritici TaxID=56615 RepID=A0A5B0MDD9_PUCGR|nr:hypothetical protein PGT21_024264 [Puccinia graminis f. sp. tritici]